MPLFPIKIPILGNIMPKVMNINVTIMMPKAAALMYRDHPWYKLILILSVGHVVIKR